MMNVLVAIPTNGKRKEVFDIVKYISRSLSEIGMKPLFSICTDDTSYFVKTPLKGTMYFSLPGKFDYSHSIIESIRRGILNFKPDFVSTIADDFILPAKQFKNLIVPLLSGYDTTFSCWGSNEIAKTYPKFQYASELFVNRIANVAPKKLIPNYKNMLSYSFDYKSDFSSMIQLFSGLFAFRTETWNNVLKRMVEIFGSTRLGWALDTSLFLASSDIGLKVTNAPCDKVKEKNAPVSGEKVTRLAQIKEAFKYVNVFLRCTKQHEKLNKLSVIEAEMIKIVEDILNKSGV